MVDMMSMIEGRRMTVLSGILADRERGGGTDRMQIVRERQTGIRQNDRRTRDIRATNRKKDRQIFTLNSRQRKNRQPHRQVHGKLTDRS
jgi:hypothetical protein